MKQEIVTPKKEYMTNDAFKVPLILIAEDVESNYLYLKAAFRNEAYELLWAQNGQEAVEQVQNRPEIGLVLMDLQMPVMNGFDATRNIKELRPELPVIAQTAFVMSDDINKARDAGCNDYMAKPIKSSELIEKVKRYI